MKKRFLSLCLTICLITSICTFMQIGVSAATSGVCGDNLTYTLDDNGILTISGTGAMYDDVWSFNYDGIKKVIVNEGVTTIGEFEFMLNETIDDVILPNGLTSIGLSAFNTTNIKRIFIPKSVTNIGRLAFFQCGKLTDVYYAGTPEDWAKINIGENNDMWLTQDIIHFGASGIEENNSTQTTPDISVKLDNVDLVFDQPPILINDRTMVPIRVIFEAMGYTVEWNNETHTATSIKGNDKIIVQLNNRVIKYTINHRSREYICDAVPQIVSGRTLVPARAVAESAGCTVEWIGETNTVDIHTVLVTEESTSPTYDESYLIEQAVKVLKLPVRKSITHEIEIDCLDYNGEWIAKIYFYEFGELRAKCVWSLDSDQYAGGYSRF